MTFYLVSLVLLRTLRAAAGAKAMPTAHVQGPVFLPEFLNLTGHYWHPVILKGFLNLSIPEMQTICNCESKPSLLDIMDIPYGLGNAKNRAYMGKATVEPKNAGVYWRDIACKKQSTTYVVYEPSDLFSSSYKPGISAFFTRLTEVLGLKAHIIDTESGFLEDYVVNEVFLGYEEEGSKTPGIDEAGTGVHQGNVHNYYIQLCGKKRWRISDRSIRFGDDRDTEFYSGKGMTYAQQQQWVADPAIYEGVTEPGDVLLNPMFLYHDAFTVPGSLQFAVTYKWDGDMMREHVFSKYLPELLETVPRATGKNRVEVSSTETLAKGLFAVSAMICGYAVLLHRCKRLFVRAGAVAAVAFVFSLPDGTKNRIFLETGIPSPFGFGHHR